MEISEQFACTFCSRTFSTSVACRRHEVMHEKKVVEKQRKGQCVCKVCGNNYAGTFSLERHMRLMHNEHAVVKMEDVGVQVDVRDHPMIVQKLVKKKKKKARYECDVCKKICDTFRDRVDHIYRVHRAKSAPAAFKINRQTLVTPIKVTKTKQHIGRVFDTHSMCYLCVGHARFDTADELRQHLTGIHGF